MNTKQNWKLVPHSYQIADTGDYDGYYEITNGKMSIYTKDDDDEALEPVVKALNESGSEFYLDDSAEFEASILRGQVKMLAIAMSIIEDYLNAGCKETRRNAHEKAKSIYKEYHGTVYVNRNKLTAK